MFTLLSIIITAVIVASVTFTATRSLYIHRFTEWYRQAINSEEIDEVSSDDGEAIYQTLRSKWYGIREVDNSIIPPYVTKDFDFPGRAFTLSDLRSHCRVARWLGYDLTLTKRDVPPPPAFCPLTPKTIRTELVECIDAALKAEEEM